MEALPKEKQDNLRWLKLCNKYLPFKAGDTVWRYSRQSNAGEPAQGWKLHISATILNACDIFERIAPFLRFRQVPFKAPVSLSELARINSGLHFGYSQVGKFVTVYPATARQAVALAKVLHRLTSGFAVPAVPFDEQFLPDSCVFYRYGAFRPIRRRNPDGQIESFIKNPDGKLVRDERSQPVPFWTADPFKSPSPRPMAKKTPLSTRFRVFSALNQRGKGGVYLAANLTPKSSRFCIIKEGRRNGEIDWAGSDGYKLLKNEFRALKELGKVCKEVPGIFSSFEIEKNFYLAMERVEGESLYDIMKLRRRRFTIKRTVEFSLMIADLLAKIHRAGWIWNDCKPANLILTLDGSLRPVDFEGAYRSGESDVFRWATPEFSLRRGELSEGSPAAGDLYSLGAVSYFLLTGKLFQPEAPVPIKKLRRNVPEILQETIDDLLGPDKHRQPLSAVKARSAFQRILREL